MEDWYPKRLAPRDGTPVILWIEDEEAPPTFPVTVGVWETDDITGAELLACLWCSLWHPHRLRPAHRRLATAAAYVSCRTRVFRKMSGKAEAGEGRAEP